MPLRYVSGENMITRFDWFYQRPSYVLGNFVMATPMLRGLSEKLGHRVLVYFSSQQVRSLYVECPFISILDKKPDTEPFCSSKRIDGEPGDSAYEAYYRKFVGDPKDMPNSYVDGAITCELPRLAGRKYVAVIHGCFSKQRQFRQKKAIGTNTLMHIVNKLKEHEIIPVILGADYDWPWWKDVNLSGCRIYIGTQRITDAVSLLKQCDAFIANDTGLYHVGGALGMKGLCIWKATDWNSCRVPSPTVQYVKDRRARIEVYAPAINNFIAGLVNATGA